MEVLNYSEFKVTDEMLASKSKRFANYVIDRIVFYGIIIVLGILAVLIASLLGSESVLNFLDSLENVNSLVDRLITTIIFIILYMIIEGLTQRTVGKLITRTKVVMENGEKPPFETIVVRSLCRMIPFNAFSFLGSIPRGWHDTISKTFVVDVQKFEDQKKSHTDFQLLGK